LEFHTAIGEHGGDAMKKFFAQLRPMERRLAVGVLVVLIVVLNWIFIWPRFSDWSNLRQRMDVAQKKLELYRTTIGEKSKYEAQVNVFQSQGQFVAPEEQAFNFLQTIRDQAGASGVSVANYGRTTTHTNQFFTELSQAPVSVIATDSQLVDFLYKLGEGASMVRVRDLDLQPDMPHQHLNANIQLIASYQKKPAAPETPVMVQTNSKPATVKPK
jgi:type II secretory pathway component PulM